MSRDGNRDVFTAPSPVIGRSADRPEVRVALYPGMCRPMNDTAGQALEQLRVALDTVARHVRLENGDMLIVNNRLVLHSRSYFTPRGDGRDRWLQRLFVRGDLWDVRDQLLPCGRLLK